METQLVYDKLLTKLDGVGSNNIAVDKFRFVLMINEAQNKIVEYFLSPVKRDENIRYVQKLLTSVEINTSTSSEIYQNFPLPQDYFEFSSVFGYASKGVCSNKRINLWEIKDQNKDEILQDEFNKPSFKYREAPYSIADNNLMVYTLDELTLDKIDLNYYRYPIQIRLIDPTDPESQFDENFQLEFDPKMVDRIISNAVSELQMNTRDEAYQINKQRTIQKL